MVLIDKSLKGINFENEKLYGHYLYTHTYIHTYIHAYIHIHTHTIKKVDEG